MDPTERREDATLTLSVTPGPAAASVPVRSHSSQLGAVCPPAGMPFRTTSSSSAGPSVEPGRTDCPSGSLEVTASERLLALLWLRISGSTSGLFGWYSGAQGCCRWEGLSART